jgi:uncharacterized membrane protein
MAQLYRGELGRSDRWRTRLDTTSNWALTTTAAVISFGFANRAQSHVTILVGIWLVVTFLIIEARRYRYYDLWIHRVRLLEDGFWAPMLRREPVDQDAIRELAQELSRPQIHLSFFSALATRINRAYGSLLVILLLTWFVKIYSHPEPARSLREVFDRAHMGVVPGSVVVLALLAFTLFFVLLYISSVVSRAPMGELRPRPRTRRLALAEMFFRPYALPQPRRPRRTSAARRSEPPHAPVS